MKELHRKTYKLKISVPFFFWEKKKVFRFRQGTLEELLEMTNWIETSNDFFDYLFYFLNNKNINNEKISKRDLNKMSEEEIFTIFEYIQKTFAKGYFKKGKSKKVTLQNYSPTSSAFATLCKELSISIDKVLLLTWEQIDFLFDGLNWNCNQMTKEGKNRNRARAIKAIMDKEFAKDDKNLKNLKKENGTRQ